MLVFQLSHPTGFGSGGKITGFIETHDDVETGRDASEMRSSLSGVSFRVVLVEEDFDCENVMPSVPNLTWGVITMS